MKKNKIGMLLLVMAVYSSCQKKQERQFSSIQVSALIDVTDPEAVLPEPETILSFYDFRKDKQKEALFRLATITDKVLNPEIEEYLAPGGLTERDNQFDDPDFRERKVLGFYAEVRRIITGFNAAAEKDTTTLRHSECFRSIAQALARIKERKMSKNILAVYSNLEESSDLYTVYRKEDLDQLFRNSDTVINRFKATQLMPKDLTGFTVLFIFLPKSREQDKLFYTLVTLYTKMLTPLGAKVIVSASNPKYLQL